MEESEFTKVKVNDVVFLDFSKYNMPSITGKVIDKGMTNGSGWAVIYELKANDAWGCTRWNRYYITSIITPAPENNDQEVIRLRQEIANLKSKINGLIMQVLELVK